MEHSKIDGAFGNWLAGYIDGEGHFGCAYYPQRHGLIKAMTINARADDFPLLLECQRATGLGRLFAIPQVKTSKPVWQWKISASVECLRLVEILETYPLRSKKRYDFAIWAQIVRENATWVRGPNGPAVNDHKLVARLAADLVAVRTYDPQYEKVV